MICMKSSSQMSDTIYPLEKGEIQATELSCRDHAYPWWFKERIWASRNNGDKVLFAVH